MRYTSDQKARTHDRIVSQASRLFRENGYDASGVDAVMEAAGLTAGGFYAHFKNKDALLSEAMEQCTSDLTGKPLAEGERATLRSFVDRYLSTAHRDRPADGCPLPPLAGEIPRQGVKVRRAFTAALLTRLNRVQTLIHDDNSEQRMDKAIEVLSSVAGAMLLARAVDDNQLSERILRVMRSAIQYDDPVLPARKISRRRRAKRK